MSDLKLATSALPSVLVANAVPTSEAAQLTAAANTAVTIQSARLCNTDAASRTVSMSIVKTGGAAGASNRILDDFSLAANTALDLGELGVLGPGDFITGVASAAGVSLVITGVTFSTAAGGGAPAGLQFDAVGGGGRSTASTTTNCSHTVGSGSNRYLIVGFAVMHDQDITAYTDYDTLTVSSNVDGALTRLVSAVGGGIAGQREGSVHLFGRANPTSGAHTITGTMSDASINADQLVINSLSYSGVSGTSGAVSTEPTSQVALNLSVSSATGNRTVFCGIFGDLQAEKIPQDFNRNIRYFNGGEVATGTQDTMLLADYPGAATIAYTTSNTLWHAGVGIDLDAA